MRKFLAVLFISATPCVYGQQLAYHSQYMFDGYLLNPAHAGSKDHIPVMLSFRNQWTGFTDAPRTMTLSAHGKLKENMGIGGGLFNDQTGPTSRSGGMLSYAFHINMDKSKLAFGVSAMFFQYKLDKSKLTTDQPDDLAIQGEVEKQIVPEASFGILYYGERFYLGVSVPQLIEMKANVGKTNNLNKMTRHYFVTGGYKFKINNDFEIEPSVLMKATAAAPVQLDFNSKFHYKKFIWLGASYRSAESVIIMLGVSKNNFSFGYSYDATLTNIKKYSTGSHEIFIGYNFGVKQVGKAMM